MSRLERKSIYPLFYIQTIFPSSPIVSYIVSVWLSSIWLSDYLQYILVFLLKPQNCVSLHKYLYRSLIKVYDIVRERSKTSPQITTNPRRNFNANTWRIPHSKTDTIQRRKRKGTKVNHVFSISLLFAFLYSSTVTTTAIFYSLKRMSPLLSFPSPLASSSYKWNVEWHVNEK